MLEKVSAVNLSASSPSLTVLQFRDSHTITIPGQPTLTLHPMDNEGVRGPWISPSNIWQSSLTESNGLGHDQTKKSGSSQSPTSNAWGTYLTGGLGFSNRGSQEALNMSKSLVARASTNGDHNTNTNSNAVGRTLASSASRSTRPIGPLSSPTRFRGNGILGIDATTTMRNFGQSPLLTGSAPDIEPSNPLLSSFRNVEGWTIGRGNRSFDIEGSTEFAPVSPKSKRHHQYHQIQYARDTLAGLDNLTISGATDRRNGYHASSGHQVEHLNGMKPSPNTLGTGSRMATSGDEADPYNGYNATPSTARTQLDRIHASPVQDAWNSRQIEDNFTHGGTMTTTRKTSNLRPDVASYQPSNHYHRPDSNNNPGYGSEYQWNGREFYSPANDDTHNRATIRNSLLANSHAFTNGSSAAGLTSSGIRQQPANLSHGTRVDLRGSRPGALGTDTQSHVFRPAAPPVSSTKLSINNRNLVHFSEPGSRPYSNAQFEYNPNGSVLPQSFQPNYATDQSPAALNYYPDGSHPQVIDSNSAPRSELLEEFRACHKANKYELKDIYGYIVEFSGDQTGSRFIQNELERANSDEKDQVFAELQPNARQLMSDVFGNYVIQKMFEYGNQSQKKALASHMQGNVFKLSLQPYGCRCVQKAFEHVLVDQQATLIKELDGHVMSVVESQHGNHVIQKAIECIPGDHIQFIVDAHKNQIVRLSKHTYGCRIIQRMLEHCSHTVRRSILDELHYAIPSLIDDQYGNYVIQCIIKKCGVADRRHVIEFVQQKLLAYSTHKFASNVVEKAIQYAEEPQRSDMVRLLTDPHPHFDMQSPLLTLLRDQYGNYVMQTVLKTIQDPYKKILADEVRFHISYMGKNGRGRQISAIVDAVDAIATARSPSSISTGPHTPRTPPSLQSSSGAETPLNKVVDEISPEYPFRDSQRNILALKPFNT